MIAEQELSDYERGALLGQGGQACVYKYTYPRTNETFAVKILKLRCVKPMDRRPNGKERDWVVREILVTSGTNHTRLLRAIEFFQYSHGFALLMPYYELGHLHAVNANQRFDLAQKRETIRQILDGLRDLHNLSRIHRDIKPDNILVQSLEPLNLVIGDFGQVSLSDPVTMVGTDVYRAPEIMNYAPAKREYTQAVDIYSVGMVILWLLGPGVVGRETEHDQLWDEEAFERDVGSHVSAAIRRYPSGEVQNALVMAQTMAQWNPEERPSAADCLRLQWMAPRTPRTPRRSSRNKAPMEYNLTGTPTKGCTTRPSKITKTKAKGGVDSSALEKIKEHLDSMDVDSL